VVDDADYEGFRLADVPERLEPGVPDVEGAAGAAAAIAYLQGLGVEACRRHVVELNRRATEALVADGRVRLIGPADPERRGSILNFHVPGVPSADLASLLDRREGVMARHGKQCVHGWYHAEGVPDSVRVSFAAYNTVEEVDRLVAAVRSVVALAGRPTL
jgi:cysteine desulfurase/selenocysteine lyase